MVLIGYFYTPPLEMANPTDSKAVRTQLTQQTPNGQHGHPQITTDPPTVEFTFSSSKEIFTTTYHILSHKTYHNKVLKIGTNACSQTTMKLNQNQ